MDLTQIEVLTAFQRALDGAENAVLIAGAIFMRITALLMMLPGFGERIIPVRVKLVAALAFAIICWPLIWPLARAGDTPLAPTLGSMGVIFAAEALIGLLLGLATRFLVFALQTAGMIAAQNLSLTQMIGAGVGPDPEPTIATIMTLGAIAVAMALGLHVKAVALIAYSYEVLPFGVFPLSGDVAEWVAVRAAETFSLAVSLALPFMVASFIYNLSLGFINRAMPQMMVAFVGMPAIILAGLMLFALTIGVTIDYWQERFDAVLAAPLSLYP